MFIFKLSIDFKLGESLSKLLNRPTTKPNELTTKNTLFEGKTDGFFSVEVSSSTNSISTKHVDDLLPRDTDTFHVDNLLPKDTDSYLVDDLLPREFSKTHGDKKENLRDLITQLIEIFFKSKSLDPRLPNPVDISDFILVSNNTNNSRVESWEKTMDSMPPDIKAFYEDSEKPKGIQTLEYNHLKAQEQAKMRAKTLEWIKNNVNDPVLARLLQKKAGGVQTLEIRKEDMQIENIARSLTDFPNGILGKWLQAIAKPVVLL